VIVIWRFTGSRMLSASAERRAQKAVAVSFWLLAPYIAIEAIRDLAAHHPASLTLLGITLTASSLAIMPVPLACDQPPMPGEQRRRGHREDIVPLAAGDRPGQCREPHPVSWLVLHTPV
jgi:hypothetical protein